MSVLRAVSFFLPSAGLVLLKLLSADGRGLGLFVTALESANLCLETFIAI